ncbi:MAG: ABC transporter ATP-binding protein/permease [Carboxylicivirga sp.]|jgi:ATP-binding cassette subfamily B protein|nr:ABC transporter ATP-binding protein/permease [Carboxylicivirga sp.]
MLTTLKQLMSYMGKRKFLLPMALITAIISTLVSLLPLVFIWLIINQLFSGNDLGFNYSVAQYAWWAMGMAISGIALYFFALMLSHLAAFRVETNMRRSAMKKIIHMPLGFFDNNTSGKIRKVIDDNASITHSFLAHQLPDLAGSMVAPLAAFVLIFVIDWRMGLATLVPIIISMLIMSFMMGKKGKHFMELYMTSLEEMNTEAIEYVRGIPVVKVFQQTVYSFKNFHNSIIRYRDMVIAYTNNCENPLSIYTVIIHGFAYLLIPLAVIIISFNGEVIPTIVNLLFYILITPLFASSIMKSMYLNQALGQAEEAVNRVNDLCSTPPLKPSSNPQSINDYNIDFKDVSFTYPGSMNKAVDSVSFSIPKGQTFAMVGESGSGKSTIAKLLPRFWDVDMGSVTIGGIDVKEVDHQELMKKVSFVFQSTRLFKTSLRENICYGKPSATEQEIEKAIHLAQCNEIIDRLPLGLETKIGTEGTYLSGGEQQRIALARAILKDAPIIVLDEATAFADPENEHLLQKAIKELTRGKTVLMIAHRLTSISNADKILVINQGTISESGSHEYLLASEGIYLRLWNEYQKAVNWTINRDIETVLQEVSEQDSREFTPLFINNKN